MADILFEIGTEEIPARFLPEIEAGLLELLQKEFSERRIPMDATTIRILTTFRRIVIDIRGMAEKQLDRKAEIKGPPLKIALTSEGDWTKAALGFAAANKVDVGALTQREGYVWASVFEKGGLVKDLIAELILQVLQKLYLPIAMRWGYEKQTFIRPVHWIVFLWNSEVVDFTFAGVKAANKTRGHRIFSSRSENGWAADIDVNSMDDYIAKLNEQSVIVDPAVRKTMIYKAFANLIEVGLDVRCNFQDLLLDEVTYLTEFPLVLQAEFDPKYLEVPNEVLSTTMQKNQKYFPAYEIHPGKQPIDYPMSNKYFVISDGDPYMLNSESRESRTKNIITGNNKVLTARLEDAKFFYEEDQKHALTDHIEKLKKIVYHEKLGTVYQKLERVVALAKWINRYAVWKDSVSISDNKLEQSAFLLKADLVTKVVYEFPELQGVIGRKYAMAQGYDADVCSAIEEHYWPKGADNSQWVPTTPLGQLLSLAEKIETIVGCYSIGIIPKGSSDPYALRRAAQGIVHILDGFTNDRLSCSLDLVAAVHFANTLFNHDVSRPVIEFIWARFRNKCENVIPWETTTPTYDVLDAVLAVESHQMERAFARLLCLKDKKADPAFRTLMDSAVRISRLAVKASAEDVDPLLFETAEEKSLYDALFGITSKHKAQNFERVYQDLLSLVGPITAFFDKVMVMAESEAIRINRLNLLKQLDKNFKRLADFEKIVL